VTAADRLRREFEHWAQQETLVVGGVAPGLVNMLDLRSVLAEHALMREALERSLAGLDADPQSFGAALMVAGLLRAALARVEAGDE